MNYAIIAAGEGSRLSQEGLTDPKPLIKIGGETLLDRLIRIFLENKASSISIIINGKMEAVSSHLKQYRLDIPLNIVEAETPSSMHSFYELSKYIPQGKLCLTTVDTIFDENTFTQYIKEFQGMPEDEGLFAVTPFVEDESPLYVEVNQSDRSILQFLDQASSASKYVSGGIYGLSSDLFPLLKQLIQEGKHRMRNFQRELLLHHYAIKAFPFQKILDIDHKSDITLAERFIQEIHTNNE